LGIKGLELEARVESNLFAKLTARNLLILRYEKYTQNAASAVRKHKLAQNDTRVPIFDDNYH